MKSRYIFWNKTCHEAKIGKFMVEEVGVRDRQNWNILFLSLWKWSIFEGNFLKTSCENVQYKVEFEPWLGNTFWGGLSHGSRPINYCVWAMAQEYLFWRCWSCALHCSGKNFKFYLTSLYWVRLGPEGHTRPPSGQVFQIVKSLNFRYNILKV